MNYWQFKISNKAWIKDDAQEYTSLKEKGYIYEQRGVHRHNMNNCIGDIVFHYNNKETKEFVRGIYLMSEIISNVYDSEGKACIKLKVLKDLRKKTYDYEIDFLNIHEYYNTTKLRGRAQVYEKIDSDFKPENLYKMIFNESYIKLDLDVINTLSLDETEIQSMMSIRKGQNKFREKLIDYWNGCSITSSDMIDILVASHIKPWKNSNNQERLDVYNGLLLLPNLDKLFDKGYISFDERGYILISSKVENYEILGINNEMIIKIGKEHLPYFEYHRKNIFIK